MHGVFFMKDDILKSIMGIVMLFSVWWLMGFVLKEKPVGAEEFVKEQESAAVADYENEGIYVSDEMETKEVSEKNGEQNTEENTEQSVAEYDMVVVVDPGHGGVDPGMVGVNNTIEKDINLQISKLLKEMLEEKGMTVILTREEDEGLYNESDNNKKTSDMKKRCEIITENGADLVISIHQNSFSDEAVSGAQVFYYKHSKEGEALAQSIQASFKERVDESNTRKAKENDTYYMLVHTPCPTVIVECGFITNYEEAALLVTEDYQKKVSEAIMEGILEYWRDK